MEGTSLGTGWPGTHQRSVIGDQCGHDLPHPHKHHGLETSPVVPRSQGANLCERATAPDTDLTFSSPKNSEQQCPFKALPGHAGLTSCVFFERRMLVFP